jgi:hypothetical protein
MTNLVEADSWDDVLQLELTTQARGGAGQVMNSQAQALLNRANWMRRRAVLALDADTTIYVAPAPAGSDANDGLTVGTPLLTLQRAWELACKLNRKGKLLKIQLANGTYSQALTAAGKPGGADYVAAGGAWTAVQIHGDLVTPGNVLLQPTAATTLAAIVVSNAYVQISGIRFDTSLAKGGVGCTQVYVCGGAQADLGYNDYGPAGGGAHINSLEGGYIYDYSDCIISGSARSHWEGWLNGYIEGGWTTITLTGTPAFTQFASSWTGALLWLSGHNFVGAATGKRFELGQEGAMHGQDDVNYYPGNAAGTFSCGTYGTRLAQITEPCTFAQLPAASATLKGVRSFVTDSSTATWGATITGGGANNVPAWCDGTNWRVG